MNHDVTLWRSQWLGRCVEVREEGGRRIAALRALQDAGGADSNVAEPIEAEVLDQAHPTPGDRVLVMTTEAGASFVVGTFGAHDGKRQPLSSGFSVECEGSALRLVDGTGRVALEIETSSGVPQVKPMESDLAIDLVGKLSVAAHSIELRSKLGNVVIHANDDTIVRGERIRLN